MTEPPARPAARHPDPPGPASPGTAVTQAWDEAAAALGAAMPPLTITLTTFTFADQVAAVYRLVHDYDRAMRPSRHGHCPTCHPEQDTRPLAVNGHEYSRRRNARRKRRHR